MAQAAGTPIVDDGFRLPPDGGVPDSVARALRMVRIRLAADALAQPRLAQMAAAAGVSPRSLQRDFARTLGLSPGAMVLRLRLSASRQTLLQGAERTVIATALRHGFEHPGRFAIAYRRAFGEAPSATLHGAGQAVTGPATAPGTVIDLQALERLALDCAHASRSRA